MSSVSAHRIFQLKLDPLTGKSEWVIIDENDDASQDPARPDLATTSYLDMLNDTWRNRAFKEAIDKTLTKPFHVLDIGAGTGLLSMMAARAMGLDDRMTPGSIKGMVTACESFLPMLKLMRKVLHVNGMERKINVINKRSDELKVGVDINSRADVLVSEILDSELLGEGLIPTLQNAHDMLLVDNPRTVPYRAMTYGQSFLPSPSARKGKERKQQQKGRELLFTKTLIATRMLMDENIGTSIGYIGTNKIMKIINWQGCIGQYIG